jgi:hypothetical protein
MTEFWMPATPPTPGSVTHVTKQGVPQADVLVTFTVSGAIPGATGTCVPAGCRADAAGQRDPRTWAPREHGSSPPMRISGVVRAHTIRGSAQLLAVDEVANQQRLAGEVRAPRDELAALGAARMTQI